MEKKVQAIVAFYEMRRVLCWLAQQGTITMEQCRKADALNAAEMGLFMTPLSGLT